MYCAVSSSRIRWIGRPVETTEFQRTVQDGRYRRIIGEIAEIAQFIAPGLDEGQQAVLARRAVQAMTCLGRRAGSMGGMPFGKPEKGRSAYRAAKPVVREVLSSPTIGPARG